MTTYAFISDVHQNLEGLTAVVADIDNQGVDQTVCLGDTGGYGPDPLPVFQLIRDRCSHVLMGNHDHEIVHPNSGLRFNPIARRSLRWSREQLKADLSDPLGFLRGLSSWHREGALLFAHGSPDSGGDPPRTLWEYVHPDDHVKDDKMRRLFAHIDLACFTGHTHAPMVIVEQAGDYELIDMTGKEGVHTIAEGTKVLVNVGSVGQSRDEDPRACYVVYDTEARTIEHRRVTYDFRATMAKIEAIPDLPDTNAKRLPLGI